MGGAGGGSGGEVVSGVGTETGQSQREGRGKNVKQRACFFFCLSDSDWEKFALQNRMEIWPKSLHEGL